MSRDARKATVVGTASRCLERGHWRPLPPTVTPRNFTALLGSSSRYRCPSRHGLSIENRSWHPGSSCAVRLDDPLSGDFNGAFSERPVVVSLLSDSLGAQVRSAIDGAIAVNPKLRRLHFAHASGRATANLRPMNLATIPRTFEGCARLLGHIAWGESKREMKHSIANHDNAKPVQIILASSGMWYNLRPYCNGTGMSLFGRGDNESCSHFVLGKRIYGSDMLMNDTDVTTARPQQFWRQYHQHFGVPPWGWYSWGRRLQGTATIKEYEEDVSTFLDAALAYAANQSTPTQLIWMETTPQHFAPLPRRQPLLGETPPPPAKCQLQPATPIAIGEPWPAELDALCAAVDDESKRAECRGDWRNRIARKHARARGVRVVPVAAALATRSDLHTGGGGDCTHWCEGSEAHAFLATSVLNVLAEAVLGM